MCTTMCTQATCVSPARYKHRHVLGVLHQSDGGKPGADQWQRPAPTRVWSKPHRGPNKPAKEGEIAKLSKIFFKRQRREAERAFWILRPRSFGREDTARRKSQFEAVEIGNIRVELNCPIETCK